MAVRPLSTNRGPNLGVKPRCACGSHTHTTPQTQPSHTDTRTRTRRARYVDRIAQGPRSKTYMAWSRVHADLSRLQSSCSYPVPTAALKEADKLQDRSLPRNACPRAELAPTKLALTLAVALLGATWSEVVALASSQAQQVREVQHQRADSSGAMTYALAMMQW